MQTLIAAKNAYDEDDGRMPIRLSDYLELLNAFEWIIHHVKIPASYETDFRRNLPAGGWRGIEVMPTLKEQIHDVREFFQTRPAFSVVGVSLLSNIIAGVKLCSQQGVNPKEVLAGVESILVRVARGDLR